MTAASPSPFDFDSPIERRGSGCFKWDSNPSADTLPMFVADMDFKAPEPVLQALQQRVAHGVFGYTWVRDEYFDAVNNWFSRRHNFPIERDWILPTIGIVPAVSAILKAFTEDASSHVGVMVQTPVYHCFFSSIRRMGCDIVESPLVADAQGVYQIDFEQFEQQAALPTTRVFLLCHPHNPSGRVWSIHELIRMGEICAKHGVTVVSDEIHCDLMFPGLTHTPFATLTPEFKDSCITLSSPSKTFNLAGLQIANIVIANRRLRSKVQKALFAHELQGVNPFGVEGLIAAYNEGEAWLDALRDYLQDNYQYIQEQLATHLPEITVYPQQATYLAWIDCSALGLNGDELAKKLLQEGELRISSGMGFLPFSGAHGDQQNHFIRLNFACPRSVLDEGLQRMFRVLKPLRE
ncbi:MalY/PatB family protein [Oceanobacter kriegii]|uniref:MalY/PatB family protein n=1 Tax=Oceanobacter kriegii TaxID=64972 RepID=UPI000414634F|nr:MalY/PatB family protein [Oceanobacter kriegii]